MDLTDERQPGLNIRTPMGMKRLSDEEMIDYYSKLVVSLGGKVLAYYLDGIAVFNKGKNLQVHCKEQRYLKYQ